jgi:broad specificity phosphatase PhoE
LTSHGEAEAAELGHRLTGIQFDAVYSSPMERARRTAEIAGFANPLTTPFLREFDYGDYEGKTSAEIHQTHPDWQLYRDGCPGGETPAQVYRRAREFIDLAGTTSGQVLAFAHGHIIRAIAVAWMSLDIASAIRFQLDVATISILAEDQHARGLKLWNAPSVS